MRLPILALFAVSGFAGLIYESIWTHYLKLFLGHAAYAQTLVLTLFMGGMTAGAWGVSRRAGGARNLLLGYALVEAAIGLCALAFHDVFLAVTAYGYEAMGLAGSPGAAGAIKWGLSALLILPQSVLMGMTFPLMSGALWRRAPERAGSAVALLYFGNSLGGAAGVLTSGFVLLEWLGLDGTIRAVGALNLAIAAAAAVLAARRETPLATETGTARRWAGLDRLLLAVALLTGLASFVYEVAWIRMLSMVLGAATHSFELMLAAFILGLALGGLWINRRIDRLREPVLVLAGIQVAMGLFAASTALTYGATFDAMVWLTGAVEKTDAGYALYLLGGFGLALALMLPATVCAGMTLPLLTLILFRRGHGEASTGAVYGANTLGAILGIGLAVHAGFPLLGLKGLLLAGCAVDVAAGLALLASLGRARHRALAAAALAGVAAVGPLAAFQSYDQARLASGVYRRGTLLDPGETSVVGHVDGKTATIHLTRTPAHLTIRTNGKPDASVTIAPGRPPSNDEATGVLAGLLPLLHRPGATVAANIGMGSGLTTDALLASPRLRRVDTLEIEQAMVDLARAFRPHNERAYSDPRSRIHIDDAKTWFATSGAVYDIIVSEPSNPWVSGVSGLFSKEFYRQAKRHLAADGVLVQWVQLYDIAPDLLASVFNALETEFGDYAIYAPNVGDILIVATPGPRLGGIAPAAFAEPGIAAAARRAGVMTADDLTLRRVGRRADVGPMFDSFSPAANSDFRPVLDLGAARSRFRQDSVQLVDLKGFWLPLGELLGVEGAAPPANVTPYPVYPVTRPFFLATLLRDRAEQRPLPATTLARELAPEVDRVLGRCLAGTQDSRVSGMLGLAAATLAYLTPADAERFWLGLRDGPCASALRGEEQAWFDLFLAVARRDGRGMAAQAGGLLARGAADTPGRRKYLVAAAMLGHLSQDDRASAAAVWHGVGQALPAADRAALPFRMLAAHAGAAS